MRRCVPLPGRAAAVPIHASGGGKAILAAMRPEARLRWLGNAPLKRYTDHTHVDYAALEADIAAIEVRGYGIDDEEHTLGMRQAAAAILDEWGERVGALSISAPTVRMEPARIESLGAVARPGGPSADHALFGPVRGLGALQASGVRRARCGSRPASADINIF